MPSWCVYADGTPYTDRDLYLLNLAACDYVIEGVCGEWVPCFDTSINQPYFTKGKQAYPNRENATYRGYESTQTHGIVQAGSLASVIRGPLQCQCTGRRTPTSMC